MYNMRFKLKTAIFKSSDNLCVLLCCSLLWILPGSHAFAQGDQEIAGSTVFSVAREKPFQFFTFTFENDIFVGEDDGFTNGTGLTYGRGPFLSFDGEIPGFINSITKPLYIQNIPNRVHGVAYNLFQTLQTPEDITIAEIQPDQLAYAGSIVLQTQLYSWDTNVSDQLSLFLGIVGPLALGEESQTFIHSLIGSDEPEGWAFQLENEPVFRIEARHVQKLARAYGKSLGFDLLGLVTVGLGNLRSNAEASLAVRFGSNMKFSHATFSLQSDRQVNSLSLAKGNDWFIYAGVSADLVANDIFIDGNTFEDSISQDLENFQNSFAAGLVAKFGPLAYVFQVTSISPAAEIQDERESFGAFSITYPFR